VATPGLLLWLLDTFSSVLVVVVMSDAVHRSVYERSGLKSGIAKQLELNRETEYWQI